MTQLERLKARKETRQAELDAAVAAFKVKNDAIARAQAEQQEAAGQINVLIGKVEEIDSQILEKEFEDKRAAEEKAQPLDLVQPETVEAE